MAVLGGIVLLATWQTRNMFARDFLNRLVFMYLDDILIFSPSLEAHHSHVKAVLQHLLEECQFHTPSTSFLGYLMSPAKSKLTQRRLRQWLSGPDQPPDGNCSSS